MTPQLLDAVFSLLGDLLIAGLILWAVKAGAVPAEFGAAAVGYLFRAVVIPPLGRSPWAQLVINWVRRHQAQAVDPP